MTASIRKSILKLDPLRKCPVENCKKAIPIGDIKMFIDGDEQ
jgi:hypothetical protein